MKKPTAKSFNLQPRIAPLIGLLCVCLLAFTARVKADEDPAGCSAFNGGSGNGSQGGINFNLPQAHVGDVVQVFPSVGMVPGACSAIDVTGTVYIATGLLTNFLVNARLLSGALVNCPADGQCEPGPYNILITPALVGAGVTSPNGSIAGGVRTVRAVQNVEGTIQAIFPQNLLVDSHTATIGIVTPCIQVVEQCLYPAETNCFPAGAPIQFTGYAINCGDIRLTNVLVADNRALLGAGLTDPNGFPLIQPLTLQPGQAVGFRGSFAPTAEEISAGSAMNVIRATARDITAIGGSAAFVTNQATLYGAICHGAIENPPGCSFADGGRGNTSQGSINFGVLQAHLGDLVSVQPRVGMVVGACSAVNVTGTVYIATGPLTNFLVNATLLPGVLAACPAGGACQPGPYNVFITPALVGAGVSSPKGNVGGVPRLVRVVQNVEGAVRSALVPDIMSDFHTTAISIVTPCIQVVEQCAYPAGTNCLPAGAPIEFNGYVTNCGDIRLVNVTVSSRAADLVDTTPPHLPLLQPLTLDVGEAVGFQGSYAPTAAEISAGSAASTITVRGTDITEIGGAKASVTNQTAMSCAICSVNPYLSAPTYNGNNQFQFTLTGQAGSSYVIQGSTNLGTASWLSLRTNAAPFTFVESNAVLYPLRFYRAKLLP